MKKILFFCSLTFAAFLIVNVQSCKKEPSVSHVENVYTYKSDTLFATIDMANEVAENINQSEVVLKTCIFIVHAAE